MDLLNALFKTLEARPLDLLDASQEGIGRIADRAWAKTGPKPIQPCDDWNCSTCQSSLRRGFTFISDAVTPPVLRNPAKDSLPNITYPLLSNDSAIRLLNIVPAADPEDLLVCTFEEFDLRTEAGYLGFSVLSYTWGTEKAVYPIDLNGQRFYVRRTLWEFLIQVRYNGWTSRIWIDAICINQTDFQERASQVQLMGEIYSRASHVLVWLGKLKEHEIIAVREMDVLQDEVQWRNYSDMSYDALGAHFSDAGRAGIRSLIRHPYWGRKWIIQELKLSTSNASVVVGRSTVPVYRLRSCFVTARLLMASDMIYRSDVRRLNLLLPSQYSTFEASSFHGAVAKFKDSLCSEPRDHVYALLGLANTTDFKVDYEEPLVNLYWRTIEKAFSDDLSQRAEDMSCFGAILQETMSLSKDDIQRRWAELVARGENTILSGYQFVEAIQLSLGELSGMINPQDHLLHEEQADLQTIDLDYRKFKVAKTNENDQYDLAFASLALAVSENRDLGSLPSTVINHVEGEGTNTSQQWILSIAAQREELMALFRIVQTHHPSYISRLSNPAPGAQFGDYAVCIVDDISPRPQTTYERQFAEYNSGVEFLRFPLAKGSAPFGYSVQGAAKIWRPSTMLEVILHTSRELRDASSDLLKENDVVCAFSNHQAALVIRRVSDDIAVCGSAAVGFQDGVLQVYMQPHSILHIQNWTLDVGKPYLRFKERCSCKPGQGGCK